MNSAEDNLTYLGGRINVAVGDNGDVGVGSLSHGLWKEILVNIYYLVNVPTILLERNLFCLKVLQHGGYEMHAF